MKGKSFLYVHFEFSPFQAKFVALKNLYKPLILRIITGRNLEKRIF